LAELRTDALLAADQAHDVRIMDVGGPEPVFHEHQLDDQPARARGAQIELSGLLDRRGR
jgi:hypothetical protein